MYSVVPTSTVPVTVASKPAAPAVIASKPVVGSEVPVPVAVAESAAEPEPIAAPKPHAVPSAFALPVAEPLAEPERVPLTVQSYIHVERLKGKPKGLIVVPFEGWVNETNEIPYKGSQKIYLLKKNGASFAFPSQSIYVEKK